MILAETHRFLLRAYEKQVRRAAADGATHLVPPRG